MQLQNAFPVPAEPDDAFKALLDLSRVAPCMPGAELLDQDGDRYHGRLKLRIGPITAAYEGTVSIEHVDTGARRAELRATGKEISGQGLASATVVATVTPDGAGSRVGVVTDLDIRGKAAQFGRGAMGEVTQRILDQFARNLEATFHEGADQPPPGETTNVPSSADVTTTPSAPAGADLDVLSVVAGPMARRAAPLVAAFAVGVLVGRLTGRRGPAPTWGQPGAWGPPPWPTWQMQAAPPAVRPE